MFLSSISNLRKLALTATVLAALATPAWAQKGHSSHSSGSGGGSGGRGGNPSWSGNNSGWHGDNGAWHGDSRGRDSFEHRGYDGYDSRYGGFWWGFWPYYSGYTPYYADNYYYPYFGDNGMTDPGVPFPSVLPAAIDVRVPANATVWFDDVKMNLKGDRRTFETPPLKTDRAYSYEVRARWTGDSGQPIEQTRHIDVHAGYRSVVDFTAPSTGDAR